MIAINLDRVSVSFGLDPIFQDLSWEIPEGRVVGLVGPNGCGKSTLLRLIAGDLLADSGFVVRRRGLSMGFLTQEPHLTNHHTVLEEMASASPELSRVEAEMAHVEGRLADPAVYGDEGRLARMLDRQARLIEEYIELGGPGHQGRIQATLKSLSFTPQDMELEVDVLSGGQKKLVGLARLLVNQPDLLLLDEPDNHLDLAGKSFLELYIRNHAGTVILVSHDRYLLDLVVDEIVELQDGRLSRYPGNYSEFVVEKQARLARQNQLYRAQKKEVDRLEQAAKRLLTWGKVFDNEKFSRRGRNILNRLEKIERIDQPLNDQKMRLELTGWRGSKKVLEIADLDMIFPPTRDDDEETILFAGLDLLLLHGERVGLVGPNGAGKSLLFRLILSSAGLAGLNVMPTGGDIVIGPSVVIGHYAQEHQTLDYGSTLMDTVRRFAPLSEERSVRFLNRFLFPYQQTRGLVGDLSGGERSRLQMALLMLSGANFLLLDEPTNNLDIPSAEVLEDALLEFEGTILVISHDRYFLDRVVDRIVELDDGELTGYLGGYSEYRANKPV